MAVVEGGITGALPCNRRAAFIPAKSPIDVDSIYP